MGSRGQRKAGLGNLALAPQGREPRGPRGGRGNSGSTTLPGDGTRLPASVPVLVGEGAGKPRMRDPGCELGGPTNTKATCPQPPPQEITGWTPALGLEHPLSRREACGPHLLPQLPGSAARRRGRPGFPGPHRALRFGASHPLNLCLLLTVLPLRGRLQVRPARLPNLRQERRRHHRLPRVHLRPVHHLAGQLRAEAQLGLQHVRPGRRRQDHAGGDAGDHRGAGVGGRWGPREAGPAHGPGRGQDPGGWG